ncbi:hypothetical protein RJ641_036158 [Dillenia turbinata]|uniref:Uncharacterized protein n=1 Tax=Dillenia turbinata TaxID=194707 RepID=A0AAN8VGQ9_9MAGN
MDAGNEQNPTSLTWYPENPLELLELEDDEELDEDEDLVVECRLIAPEKDFLWQLLPPSVIRSLSRLLMPGLDIWYLSHLICPNGFFFATLAREAFNLELNEDCLISLSFLVQDFLGLSPVKLFMSFSTNPARFRRRDIAGFEWSTYGRRRGRGEGHWSAIEFFKITYLGFISGVGVQEFFYHLKAWRKMKGKEFAFVEKFICWGSGSVSVKRA